MIGIRARLYRQSGAPGWMRRRASVMVSFGAAAFLLVCVSVLMMFKDDTGVQRPRFLAESGDGGGSYPFDDALIDRPYRDAGKRGQAPLIIVHIIVIAYMLLGLNTVCDLYFTGALDEMVNKWDIKPDVAGATFMAAGGSAPELFTSLIGAVIESDVGFGTIVGSAVFNVLFVIGLCGLAAEVPIKLTWWPLARDCTYYIFGLSVLAACAKTDRSITWWEALLLFMGYLGYCTIMYYNPQLEDKFVHREQDPVTDLKPVIPVAVAETGSTGAGSAGDESPTLNLSRSRSALSDDRHHIKKSQPHFERKSMVLRHSMSRDESCWDKERNTDDNIPEPEDKAPALPVQPEDSEEDMLEEEEDDIEALLEKPEGTGPQVIWYLCMPVYASLYYGIPKPTEKCFLATFGISLLWIGGFSFWLVYCVEVLGEVIGIHIIIMGFTLLAAGTSIPDLVSSMAVARAGEGDMAVSSSIGSNIFDILVGLPIPWLIKIIFVEILGKGNSGYTVRIVSDYIVVYVIILVAMVLAVIVSIHVLGWYLNKVLGVGMAVLYSVFLIVVLVVEFNQPEALKF